MISFVSTTWTSAAGRSSCASRAGGSPRRSRRTRRAEWCGEDDVDRDSVRACFGPASGSVRVLGRDPWTDPVARSPVARVHERRHADAVEPGRSLAADAFGLLPDVGSGPCRYVARTLQAGSPRQGPRLVEGAGDTSPAHHGDGVPAAACFCSTNRRRDSTSPAAGPFSKEFSTSSATRIAAW